VTNKLSALQNLNHITNQVITPLFSKQVVVGEKQMVVWATLKRTGRAAVHSHPEEQTFWVTSGCMELRFLEEVYRCDAGSVITVPSNVVHEAVALEDTTFVSFLSGVRVDLVGTDVPEHFKSGR